LFLSCLVVDAPLRWRFLIALVTATERAMELAESAIVGLASFVVVGTLTIWIFA
jgi:hypothetical protein